MEISDLIKSARIEKGLTQQQLADVVFVTRQTISKWELGKSVPDQASLYCYTSIWTSSIMRKNSYQSLFLISKILY